MFLASFERVMGQGGLLKILRWDLERSLNEIQTRRLEAIVPVETNFRIQATRIQRGQPSVANQKQGDSPSIEWIQMGRVP